VFLLATGATVIWPLPGISAMAAFQVRGALNAFKSKLTKDIRVGAGFWVLILATLVVNIPLHFMGMANTAAPNANRWVAGFFGIVAVGIAVNAVPQLGSLMAVWWVRVTGRAALISSVAGQRFAQWWERITDRVATMGAAATLAAIPFMVYAVFVHPDFDGIVTIHPVVHAMVLATFTGFGGEALLPLFRKVTGTISDRFLAKYSVYSAVTVSVYGLLYQLHYLPLQVPVTAGLVFAGLLLWGTTRPGLTAVGRVVNAAIATVLTAVGTLAATALLFGWPVVPAAVGVAAAPVEPVGGAVSHAVHIAAFGVASVMVRVAGFQVAALLQGTRALWATLGVGLLGLLWLAPAILFLEAPDEISWLLSVGFVERVVLVADVAVLALGAHHLDRARRGTAVGSSPKRTVPNPGKQVRAPPAGGWRRAALVVGGIVMLTVALVFVGGPAAAVPTSAVVASAGVMVVPAAVLVGVVAVAVGVAVAVAWIEKHRKWASAHAHAPHQQRRYEGWTFDTVDPVDPPTDRVVRTHSMGYRDEFEKWLSPDAVIPERGAALDRVDGYPLFVDRTVRYSAVGLAGLGEVAGNVARVQTSVPSAGSAVVVGVRRAPDGSAETVWLLTNQHVVEEPRAISVRFPGTARDLAARRLPRPSLTPALQLSRLPSEDLRVLRVDVPEGVTLDVKAMRLAPPSAPISRAGVTVGYPLGGVPGTGTGFLPIALGAQSLRATDRFLVETSHWWAPGGQSGGPLLEFDGNEWIIRGIAFLGKRTTSAYTHYDSGYIAAFLARQGDAAVGNDAARDPEQRSAHALFPLTVLAPARLRAPARLLGTVVLVGIGLGSRRSWRAGWSRCPRRRRS
jgi:hypothetical protein